MPSGNESDSDDSVIIVPYVKPKPPEIVLDSDDEDQLPKDSVLARKATVQEEVIVQVDSVPVQSVPVVIQETSKTVVAGPSGVQAETPSSSKSKRTTNTTNTAKKDNGKNNMVDGDLQKGKRKSLDKKTNGKNPAENEAVANSSKSSGGTADNSGKKKRKSRTETVSVVDGSVESDPSAKVPPKRRKKDSKTIHPSQAAAVDHFRFMQQLNLFPEDAPEPKVKKNRKKGTSPSSVISPAEIEALSAQISFDIQNIPIRIRPFEAIAYDSSLASFDSSTPANATIEPTQEVSATDVSIGFVSVTEETTGKPRKKRPKESIQNVVPVFKDKSSPPSAKVVTDPEVENLQNHPGQSKIDKKKVKTKAKMRLMKAVKQKNIKGKERQEKKRGGETDLSGSNDVVWTTGEKEEDNITTAELHAVRSSITLNVGDGRSRLTVDQMRDHAMRKSKPDPTKPRIFDPSLTWHGTKRSASPSGLPTAKARTVGTTRARTRQVVQVPTEIDIPWDVSKEGQLEDRSFPNTWSRRMMEFYGGITKDTIDLEGVWRIQDTSPNLWKTREELERSGMRSNKKRHLKCINCKMFCDHLSKDCPRRKVKRSCFMCGDPERAHSTEQFYQSNHTASAISTKCPKASCLNCGQKLSGKFMQRCQKCAPLFKSQNQKCPTCKLQGHKLNTCPDNWRRFHSITNEAQLLDPVVTKSATEVKYKKQKNSFCPNCGQKGHSYFECESRRQLNQWYSPAHPMIHGEPGMEALDGTSHPAAHVMPLRTSRQTSSINTQRMAPKAPFPAKSSAVTKKKSKCKFVPDAVVTNNTEPTGSKQHSYESSSTPQPSNVVSNYLGAELYLRNKKASNIVGHISAQIRATRRSVEESVQPTSTTSPKEDASSEAMNRSNAPESVERYPEIVSSSTNVPKPSGSAVRHSTSFTRKDGNAKELVCVSSSRSQSQSISDPDEVLYDRRRRSPRPKQASQQSQTDQEFESILYGEGNPVRFRERPALQTGNIWTNAIQDSHQNRHQIPSSVFSSPHPVQGGTSQVPMNVSPPLMQNWPIEGNNYGPYPYDQNQYINPFFQQPHPQQLMGGWQNMQRSVNHPFVQDSYTNMVVQQQHDFYVPPPQQFHLMGPGPNQIRHSSWNYRCSEDRQHFRNQEFRRGRGRGGYVRRPRGANRWVRPTR